MRSTDAILVTGLPRSGTTFVGRVLELDPGLDYLWEPFNSRFRAGVPHHYPYIGRSTPQEKRSRYAQLVEQTVSLRELRPALARTGWNPAQLLLVLRTAGGWRSVARRRRRARDGVAWKLLVKDPVALFLSGYLARHHGFRVVIVVRHPMALHRAWRALGWRHDFGSWVMQADLRADYLTRYEDTLEQAADDPLVSTALLWRVAYEYSLDVAAAAPDLVVVVRHEDLCLDPLGAFRRLYDFCGIELTGDAERSIHSLTGGDRTDRATKDLSELERRDAVRLAHRWKDETDQPTLDRMHELTADVADRIYPEDEWWVIGPA